MPGKSVKYNFYLCVLVGVFINSFLCKGLVKPQRTYIHTLYVPSTSQLSNKKYLQRQ